VRPLSGQERSPLGDSRNRGAPATACPRADRGVHSPGRTFCVYRLGHLPGAAVNGAPGGANGESVSGNGHTGFAYIRLAWRSRVDWKWGQRTQSTNASPGAILPFFQVVTGRDFQKSSKASLLGDDKVRVFNGLSYVIGTDTRFTITCSAITDGSERDSFARARDSLHPPLGWVAIKRIEASVMFRSSASRLSKTAGSRCDGAERFTEALQL